MGILARTLFGLFCGAVGFIVSYRLEYRALLGAVYGVACAIVIIMIEFALARRSTKHVVAGMLGLAVGLIVANLVSYVIIIVGKIGSSAKIMLYVFSNLALGYLGMVIAVRRGADLVLGHMPAHDTRPKIQRGKKVLDTSVIIDGRIADISEARFIDGIVVVPRFVLEELQYIADSPDDLKRARGRRGLDILKKLQAQEHVSVIIEDVDMADLDKVDSKIVRYAQQEGASILTTDYNLNKVASLHGVVVLNINDLAKALKPVFLPGEEIEVKLAKRGKEPGQGVGYLDDGTMVVVDEGSTRLGARVVSIVTSVLQTTAGRMIFARLKK
jgi:uncharacterized protein YacL